MRDATQALTPQALMKLADDYARCAATAHVESLYGGSKSYTAECQKHENEARSKLSAALSAAPAAPAGEPVDKAACLGRDPDAQRAANGAAKHYRESAAPLYAAPAPAEPAPAWQPIRKAPKERYSTVLVALADGDVDIAQLRESGKWGPTSPMYADYSPQPRVFMPLPAAPASPKG